jgi:hypothetical protein
MANIYSSFFLKPAQLKRVANISSRAPWEIKQWHVLVLPMTVRHVDEHHITLLPMHDIPYPPPNYLSWMYHKTQQGWSVTEPASHDWKMMVWKDEVIHDLLVPTAVKVGDVLVYDYTLRVNQQNQMY